MGSAYLLLEIGTHRRSQSNTFIGCGWHPLIGPPPHSSLSYGRFLPNNSYLSHIENSMVSAWISLTRVELSNNYSYGPMALGHRRDFWGIWRIFGYCSWVNWPQPGSTGTVLTKSPVPSPHPTDSSQKEMSYQPPKVPMVPPCLRHPQWLDGLCIE